MLTNLSKLLQRRASSRRRRTRLLFVAIVAIVALLSSTVAIAQYSQDFDLACRSHLTAASGVITGGNFGVNGALGLSMVPPADSDTTPTYAVRSQDFAVRAGFLPGYPNGQGPIVTVPDQNFIQHLPLLAKVGRIIRGGC